MPVPAGAAEVHQLLLPELEIDQMHWNILLQTIEDTDFASVVDEDDCSYGDVADLATAGKDISNEGNNGTVDIDVTHSNPHDSSFRYDVEEGLGNETWNEQTEIASTKCTLCSTKIEEKDDKTTLVKCP